MVWDGIRPTSLDMTNFTGAYASNSLSFDVQSSAPDTTTVGSFDWGNYTNPTLIWAGFEKPGGGFTQCDSYYTFGFRHAIQNLSDDYWSIDYSVDSGANWTTWISSRGNEAATTFTRSLASTTTPTYYRLRYNTNKVKGTDSSATFQIWDVFAVSSYTAGEARSATIADNLGLTGAAVRNVGYSRTVVT